MNDIITPARSIKKKASVSATHEIKTSEAINLMSSTCSANISITLPVGGQLSTKCKTIGFHSGRLLLVEVPELKKMEMTEFMREGFWAKMKVFTGRGNGSVLSFRCQIAHVITTPLPLIALSIPTSMQQQQIRRSPRFEVDLPCTLQRGALNIEAKLRDISKQGCLVETSLLSKMQPIGNKFHISFPLFSHHFSGMDDLYCTIRGAERGFSGIQYGVEFDDKSQVNAKIILSLLTFDGNKLTIAQ